MSSPASPSGISSSASPTSIPTTSYFPRTISWAVSGMLKFVSAIPVLDIIPNFIHYFYTKEVLNDTDDAKLREAYFGRYFIFIKHQNSYFDIRHKMIPGYTMVTTLGATICDVGDLFSKIIGQPVPAAAQQESSPLKSVELQPPQAAPLTLDELVAQATATLLKNNPLSPKKLANEELKENENVPKGTNTETEKVIIEEEQALQVIMIRDASKFLRSAEEAEKNRNYREAHDLYLIATELFSKVKSNRIDYLKTKRDLDRMKILIAEQIETGRTLYFKGSDLKREGRLDEALINFELAATLITKDDTTQFDVHMLIHDGIKETKDKQAEAQKPKKSLLDSIKTKLSSNKNKE